MIGDWNVTLLMMLSFVRWGQMGRRAEAHLVCTEIGGFQMCDKAQLRSMIPRIILSVRSGRSEVNRFCLKVPAREAFKGVKVADGVEGLDPEQAHFSLAFRTQQERLRIG